MVRMFPVIRQFCLKFKELDNCRRTYKLFHLPENGTAPSACFYACLLFQSATLLAALLGYPSASCHNLAFPGQRRVAYTTTAIQLSSVGINNSTRPLRAQVTV